MSDETIPLPEDIAADLGERVKLWQSMDTSHAAGKKIQEFVSLAGASGSGQAHLNPAEASVDLDVPAQIGQTLTEAGLQAGIVTKAQAELATNRKVIAEMERSRRKTIILLIVFAVVLVLCLVLAVSSGVLGGRR